MRVSETDWNAANSAKHQGDGQAFYFAQCQAILRGELDMVINDDHESAWQEEKRSLAEFFARAKQPQELF